MTDNRPTFHEKVAERWKAAIASIGMSGDTTKVWEDLPAIESALQPFIGNQINHAHLPSGGGFDFKELRQSREINCLEAFVESRLTQVFKPERLVIENFPQRPQETFLLLELGDLTSTGAGSVSLGSEEVADVPGRGYMDRTIFDQGFIGYSEDGEEIPIPQDAKLVVRWLAGKILIVAKGSLWNGSPETYRGQHNNMTHKEIREAIESALSRQ